MEFGYFGEVFDRPAGEPLPWIEPDAEDNADMWATVDESREWVVDFYRRACTHADSTIDAFDLDARAGCLGGATDPPSHRRAGH